MLSLTNDCVDSCDQGDAHNRQVHVPAQWLLNEHCSRIHTGLMKTMEISQINRIINENGINLKENIQQLHNSQVFFIEDKKDAALKT